MEEEQDLQPAKNSSLFSIELYMRLKVSFEIRPTMLDKKQTQ